MKKVTLVMAALCLLIAGIVVSCSKSNEEELSTGNPNTCDTVNMTYSADVVPVLEANCYGCHGNGQSQGGASLDTYDGVKAQADNGALLGTITHASGYPAMPKGSPKLSDCNINIIRSWVNHGALDN